MSSLTDIRKLRAALALLVVLSVIVGPVVGSDALAAVGASPMDPVGDQLRDKLNDIINIPTNFCDPKAVLARNNAMAIVTSRID